MVLVTGIHRTPLPIDHELYLVYDKHAYEWWVGFSDGDRMQILNHEH